MNTRATRHGSSKNLWQGVRSTSLRRLTELGVRTREAGLVAGIHHIAEGEQRHAEPHRGAVNRHHDRLGKGDQRVDEISANTRYNGLGQR